MSRIRFIRINREAWGIKPFTVGVYDGGPLKFFRFLRIDQDDYFVSISVVHEDRTNLFTEVTGTPEYSGSDAMLHPDILGGFTV